MKAFQSQTLYEVLEVSVGATPQDIRAAHERLRRLYGEDQVALYGLIEPSQAAQLHLRLDEALAVLSDDARRDDYDRSIGLPPREAPPRPLRPPPAPAGAPEPTSASGGWTQGFAWVTTSPSPSASRVAPAEVLAAPPASLAGVPGEQVERSPALQPPPVPPVAPGPGAAGPQSAEPVEGAARDGRDPPVEAPAAPAPPPALAATAGSPPPPEAAAPREPKAEVRPKPFELPAGVEFNGDLLRQVRLARGVSLVQIAERTRIGARHLENLEADRFDALPATVYLRGILMSLARELGLDGVRVARSYLQFVEAHRTKG